jgi:hypothetical protein
MKKSIYTSILSLEHENNKVKKIFINFLIFTQQQKVRTFQLFT